jgi:pimeloyl-ACP methyl ester carboxylesterase
LSTELPDGPVLLVGHSRGGAIITEAGNDVKVSGLVYIAAAAPDSGESFNEWWMGSPLPDVHTWLPPSSTSWSSSSPNELATSDASYRWLQSRPIYQRGLTVRGAR